MSDGFDKFKDDKEWLPHKVSIISREYTPPPFIYLIQLRRHVSKSALQKNSKVPGFWIEWYYNADASMYNYRKVNFLYLFSYKYLNL